MGTKWLIAYINMVYMHILLSSQLKNRNRIMKWLNKPRTAIGIVLLVWKETLYKNSLVFNAENCLRQAIARYLKKLNIPLFLYFNILLLADQTSRIFLLLPPFYFPALHNRSYLLCPHLLEYCRTYSVKLESFLLSCKVKRFSQFSRL